MTWPVSAATLSAGGSVLLEGLPGDYTTAIASISTKASIGRRATSKADRAGGAERKKEAYSSFMAEKSSMLFKNTVVLMTLDRSAPASLRIARRFVSDCRVWARMPPCANWPVAGSIGS